MKFYHTLTMACAALFLFSCQKEAIKSTLSNTISSASLQMSADETAIQFKPSSSVKYGAMICTPDPMGDINFQLAVADQLGVSCLRSRTLVPGTGKVPILNTDYKILLNFSSDFRGVPLPFVSDLKKYKTDLTSIVSTFTVNPVVAVIENEESNLKYFTGRPKEYLKQLSAAISVMHAYGIKVANGGITSVGLSYLVYQDYMKQGKTAEAKDFQQRTKLNVNDPVTQERGAFIDTLLQGYTKMNVDYVNFHWKGLSPDATALGEAIAYLKKVTNKTIISNELGQLDTDTTTLLTHVQMCTDNRLAYAVWYSPIDMVSRGMPLQYTDASLTNYGFTYKDYLAK